jgi:hypothetical protein
VELTCQDLAGRGVGLVASKSEIAATLRNRSTQAIAGYAIEWRWESGNREQGVLISRVWEPQLLLPSSLSAKTLGIIRYRSTILPGSSRLLTPGLTTGDNSDVRPPQPEEIFRNWITLPDTPRIDLPLELRTAALTLDGVIFDDGEFIGPNHLCLWEEVYWASEVMLQVARIATLAVERGATADEAMNQVVEFIDGSNNRATVPLDFEARVHRTMKSWCKIACAHHEPEGMLELFSAWLEAPGPKLRRV